MAITALSTLPEEMEVEVLLRLPVKSILRFSTVCLRWAALRSSDRGVLRGEDEACRVEDDGASKDVATYSTLPRERPPCCRRPCTLYGPSSAGLGFDARTKEHKVVRLFSSEERTKCEVHTLGRGPDSRWRPPISCADTDGVVVPSMLAGAALFATILDYGLSPVFADGFLHWFVDPNFDYPTASASSSTAAVLSFSLAEETFSSRVRPPPFDMKWEVLGAHLAELDGRLCIVRDLRRGSSGSLEIWSYGAAADGGDDNWTLEHHIDLAHHAGRHLLTEPKHIRVVGASVGKKVIFVATSKCNV
ncbi:hypothetical protein ACQ4PT_059716 [Festuca glaucescens]